MTYGRLNIVVGGIVIFVASLGGFVLGFSLDPFFEKGFYQMSLGRFLLRASHTHGMPFAFYNLIIGILLDKLALSNTWKKRCSVCAAISLIMPIGLVLRGLTDGAMTFAPVVLVGAFFFLASAALMIKGAMAIGSTCE